PIRIEQGHVRVAAPLPYVIRNSTTGAPIAIIDTAATMASLAGSPAFVVLGDHTLMVRKSAQETRTYDLSQVRSFSIDRQRISRWVRTLFLAVALAFAPLYVGFSYLYRLAQVLLVAAIGMLLAKRMG